MISSRLKNIFAFSIPLFIAHGLEEYFFGFYNIDSHIKFMFGYFEQMMPLQATFLIFQIMLWLLLIVSYFLIRGERWRLWLMAIPGIIFIYELHHFYKALDVGGYYPGLVTALLFPVIGYLYWKEWTKCIKR
jgi:hypothetical protein